MPVTSYQRVDHIPSYLEVRNRDDSATYRRLANLVLLHAKSRAALTDDEIIVLSMIASQAALWRHLDPDNDDVDDVMTELLAILDDYHLNLALERKMARMVDGEETAAVDPSAPRPEDMPEITVKWPRDLAEADDAPDLEDLP
jgi:hypothetical protein